MSGIAAAFLPPSTDLTVTAFDRLKQMVPKLSHRGQAEITIAAFMQKDGLRYSKAPQSSYDSLCFQHYERDPAFRPHVAIANLHSRGDRPNDFGEVESTPKKPGTSRPIAIALDGALVNGGKLRAELLAEGHMPADDTDAELLLNLIDRSFNRDGQLYGAPTDYENTFRDIDHRIDGAITLLLLDGEGNLIAYRNRPGLRPLEIMQLDDGSFLFASENCAFAGLKGELRQLLPGHIINIDGKTGSWADHSLSGGPYKARLCAYEALYLGNPDSSIEGQSHFQTRYNIGLALGHLLAQRLQKEKCSAPAIVSSMPHTGGPYADGLFAALAESGVLAERREVVATQFTQRTLIGAASQRKARIAEKYRLSQTELTERTIVIVDEALIRGDTSQAVIRMLLAAGATAVHWAIGSPPIVSPNYYGLGIETLEELVFWRVWKKLPPEQRSRTLRFHKMEPEALETIESSTAASIKAATVTYLPFPVLVSLLPCRPDGFDLSPFTLEMPTGAGQKRADRNLRQLMADLPDSEPIHA
ncbi:hypothetical protein PY650_26580 [Rhizobium calliandrae]|uniref:Glutamine amidotransferase type-2 domain-containing protein n=1 Tax=Rhizobium calliandrae TaxID=1312182 RepID=A0ABT7KKH7_9HYPH|nr:hypothetical protein [Rhizobium calliandrae]MDL2409139.1 hypothetical protein [Rhizobium calliandrae]